MFFTPIAEAEHAALGIRTHWGLGLDPIPNLVDLLQERGIKVLMRFGRLCFRALAEGAISEAKAAELLGHSVRELNHRMDAPPA